MPPIRPNEIVRDVIDSALDIVGTPASMIRGGKDEVKAINGEVSNAAGGGGRPPDPVGAVARVANAALSPAQNTVNQIKSRIDRIGR